MPCYLDPSNVDSGHIHAFAAHEWNGQATVVIAPPNRRCIFLGRSCVAGHRCRGWQASRRSSLQPRRILQSGPSAFGWR